MTIVGGATKSGWTENEYHRTVGRMVRTAENTWIWVGKLTSADGDDGNFKIPNTLTGWNGYWADEADKQIGVSDVEEFTLSTASAGDKKFHVTSTGMYRITVNTNTLKMTVEKLTEPTKDGDYYRIGNVDQLMWYAGYVTSGENEAKARLTADISFEGKNFFPISSDKFKFKGELDGAGHTIDYAVIDDPSPRHGLCRYLGPGANIHDLIMGEHCSFTGLEKTGGIAGNARDGGTVTLTNVINRANVTSTGGGSGHEGHAAGLVAAVTDATKIVAVNCANMGKVKGQNGECAGLAGWVPDNAGSSFTNCWNIGTIESDLDGASNQLCRNQNHVTLTNCYNLTSQGSQGTHLEAGALGSGELCFKLNGDQSDIAWYQNLSGTVDAYPVPFSSHKEVYKFGSAESYLNDGDNVTIATASDLDNFSTVVNAGATSLNAEVSADITANAAFTPIGTSTYMYKGTFDGNGKSIELSINNTSSSVNHRALIGYATGGATIQNLILTGSVVSSGGVTAGFIAEAKGGGTVTITNCGNEATISGGANETAAIIANNNGNSSCILTLTNVYNRANVSGSGDVSTICGYQGNYESVFTNVYNSGTPTKSSGDLQGHFARGTINPDNVNPTSIGTYTRCYSTTLNSNPKHDNPGVTNIRKIEASDVSSGELTCLLNGSTNGGTNFYQSLGTDNYPVLDSSHGKVWKSLCAEHDDEIQYSNSAIGQSTSHVFDEPNATGHCTQCQQYYVSTGAQMKGIADGISGGTIDNNIHIYFTQDIDFAGVTGYAGIGTDTDGKRFCGILDGQNHSVNNMTIDSSNSGVGLIGTVSDGAHIRNVIVTSSCTVKGSQYVAGIVGSTNGTGTGTVKITRCGNEAAIQATNGSNSNAAGILGCRRGSNRIEISNCYNAGTIKGPVECAGISAWMGTNFSLNKCYNIGSIDSKVVNDQYLVRVDNNTGNWNAASSITDCYQLNTNKNFIVNDTTYTKSETTYTIKAISSEVFASGELCYKLNGEEDAGTDWYQTLSTDNYPVLFDTHEMIYYVVDKKCNDEDAPTYKNSSNSVVLPHEYDDGWCTLCNAYGENAFSPIDGWYQISTAKQLRWIAESVNEYNSTYKGINIKLTSDIDYRAYTDQAAMIGKPSNTYQGTFDGQNHTVTVAFNNTQADETALFRRINGGTVKNLKVNGTISTNKKFAAGICSGIWDYGSISNCESAVTITDVGSGDATHGGILACVNNIDNKKNIKVLNCLFSGTLSASDRDGCGGIVGWTDNNANVKVKNCLVSGTLDIADANTNGIIVRSSGDIENNYYTCTVSGSSIKKDYATEASASAIETGELCYLLNGRTSGGTGWYQTIGTDDMPTPLSSSQKIYANGSFYCDGVTPKGSITYGNTNGTVIDSHSFVNNLCTGCKAVGEEPSNVEGVYQIANIGHLIWFASHVNSGNTTASGVLTDNIVQGDAVYVPIGTEDNIYTGRFDGQGHTVNLALNNPTRSFQGLFGVVTDGVFIEKVVVTGSVSGNNYVGGIVGGTMGGSGNVHKTNIWYCGNEANITAAGVNAGGIIGVNMGEGASIIITNCYNRGNIQGKNQSGALSGWLGGGWSSVRNCYNTGTVKNGDTASKAFGRNSGCYFKNCYSTTSSGTDNSTENTTNGVPAVVEDATVASGVLCAKLGYGFRQNLGEDTYPNFNVEHGFVNQIGAVGYSTQFNAMSDVTIPAGVEAFAGVNNGDRVTLVRVEDKIKAGVPVVLKASTPGCYNFMPTTGADEPANNDLRGSNGSVAFGENIYVLANKNSHGIGFYKTEGSGKYVPEGRAYLNNSGSPVKEAYLFSFDDEENETAITNVNVNGNGNNAAIYNMAGQRISKLQKGINIVNGKKVLF